MCALLQHFKNVLPARANSQHVRRGLTRLSTYTPEPSGMSRLTTYRRPSHALGCILCFMLGDLHPVPFVVQATVRVTQLKKGSWIQLWKIKTQRWKKYRKRERDIIVSKLQREHAIVQQDFFFPFIFFVFIFGKTCRQKVQTCTCGASERNASVINLVWTLFCDRLKNMKRFITFYAALSIFVGVLLNFAWLYHLLLPSEVIFFLSFPEHWDYIQCPHCLGLGLKIYLCKWTELITEWLTYSVCQLLPCRTRLWTAICPRHRNLRVHSSNSKSTFNKGLSCVSDWL